MLDFLLITLKKAFDTWKTDWTASRAQKIDTIESRLSSTRMSILDGLNNRLSSIERALNGKVNQVSIENLTKKVDGVISAIASKASQTSLEEAEKEIIYKIDRAEVEITHEIDRAKVAIEKRIAKGMVKRVQRGLIVDLSTTFLKFTRSGTETGIFRYYKNVSLPYSVDSSKAIAHLEVAKHTANYSHETEFACQLLNDGELRIIAVGQENIMDGYPVFSWQVIEYY